MIEPYLRDADVTLYNGDALDVLRTLPDRSVHMCATSPPFYGLRDYHVDGQIGLEETPDMWVARLVDVFREVRRVLRDDCTLWVEIGDSYNTSASGAGGENSSTLAGTPNALNPHSTRRSKNLLRDLKPKDLLGQPWMLAFALRADGWYLRSEIIWARPNPMPESVTDRPTKSHSTVFLLSKRPRYYFDAEAIREAYSPNTHSAGRNSTPGSDDPEKAVRSRNNHDFQQSAPLRHVDVARLRPQVETLDGSEGEAPRGPDGRRATAVKGGDYSEQHRDGERWPASGANARSVWSIATEPTPFAHFATWPRKLVARMIAAGTSERGCCPECGAPWVRQTEAEYDADGRTTNGPRSTQRRHESPGRDVRMVKLTNTLGWSPSCAHGHEPVPCVVLDPFAGSGTTLLVARHHVRHSIGIELSLDYCEIAAFRLAQQSLLTELA